ncbi:Hypothetical predicted protein [Mytilus galloprovincialis]|uniref:Chitin-binding type-2 domain-containing protein n=1 Tax=Mytilus galloprovincialis TaxID=29158 RepID=A0A8B6D123_MYTGA|nr:Hypothetical predicted protein [Mytilus galloprovincialis]
MTDSIALEEEHFVRMSLLLTGISPRSVRILFDKEFAPICLHATLKKEFSKLRGLKHDHVITQLQWNLLNPKFPDVPSSKKFDATLMILLLRHLTTLIPPHAGYDTLPKSSETTPASDLARIKYYRNFLAHLEDATIESTEFIQAWDDITGIIDFTGDRVKDERGNTQILIDQTKDDYSKTRKRKLNNAENGAGHMNTNNKLVDGLFKSKIGEHSNAACGREEPNPNLSSSDTSNASSEPYVIWTEANQVHTNPNFIGDSGESGSDAAYTPTTSINSDYDDPTTKKFMLQPGIHVPSNMKDTPNFNNIMRMGNMQFLLQHQVTSSHSSFHNNDVKLNDENEGESEPDQTSNSSRHDRTTWPKIDRPTVDEELDTRDHVYLPSDDVSIQSSSYFKSQKKKCNWRKWIIIIFVYSCLSVVAALIVQNEYGSKKETPGDPPTPSLIVDKCENDISTATVGEQICIPYTQQFTSNPSGIQVKQVSSQYLSALPSFSINVSSDTVSQKKENWIVYFNISRPDQQLRLMKENATCDSIGIYEITIEYDDGNFTSFKFEISFKDPQLKQIVTRINYNIHVHCEMTKTCMASSLALFVNDGGSSRLIPDIDVCSFTDKNSGTTVSADAIIHVSQLSENQTISCVPLMTNMELAANLTSTSDCIPDCKDDPQSEAYFPDKNDCTKFYQCSNGKLVFQTCSSTTYWSPSKCTCDHFDDEICNKDTNKFFKPLLSIEKCIKASLV